MTSTGMIMCADSSLADALAINAGDLVGRSFSNLCTDVEGVTRCVVWLNSPYVQEVHCTCRAESLKKATMQYTCYGWQLLLAAAMTGNYFFLQLS